MADTDSAHQYQIKIAAPIVAVWHVLAERFDRIDEWASGVPKSWGTGTDHVNGSPFAGRVCASSIPGFDDVTESIIEYGEDPHFFTYKASGMPAWMGVAMNTWHVESIDESTTLVYFEPEVQAAGLLGRVILRVFMVFASRLARETLDDLKIFVETGHPSPRKLKKLAKAG